MRRVMVLGALALALAGCGGEAALPNVDINPFKSDPTLSVALQAISGQDVTIRISATNFKALAPAAATDKHKYGEGHFHIFVDVLPTPPGSTVPAGVTGVYHTPDSSYTIHGLPNGPHRLFVVLGFSDHLPYQAFQDSEGKFHGAIAELDFTTGPGQTQVTAPEANATPSTAPSASSPASAAAGTIKLVSDPTNGGAYDPNSKSVHVGDTVEWDWVDDSASHSVTSDDGKFDSGLKSKGDKFTFKFSSAGTYKYHCSVHPNMLGTITVQ